MKHRCGIGPGGVRRVTAVAAAAVSVLGLTVACGGGGGSSSGNASLTYAIWDKSQVPIANQVIAKFEKSHPKIKVRVALTPYSTYFTKLRTAASSGTAPDVFWLSLEDLPLYASGKQLLPVTKQAKSDHVDLSAFTPASITGLRYKGELWALPDQVSTVGLWYNKALFKAAGLSTPTDTWTWDDVTAAARKLTDKKHGVYGIASTMDEEIYYNLVWQAGGEMLTQNNTKSGLGTPAAVRGLTFWTDLINRYHASPTLSQMTDTDPSEMFSSGKLGMVYQDSSIASQFAQVPYVAKNGDLASLPGDKNRSVLVNTVANYIYAKSKHPDAAWQFVKFLGSNEAQTLKAKVAIPALKSAQSKWTEASAGTFHLDTQIKELNTDGKLPPVSTNSKGWEDPLNDVLAPAWKGTKSVDQVEQSAATMMNQALSKAQ